MLRQLAFTGVIAESRKNCPKQSQILPLVFALLQCTMARAIYPQARSDKCRLRVGPGLSAKRVWAMNHSLSYSVSVDLVQLAENLRHPAKRDDAAAQLVYLLDEYLVSRIAECI